MHHILPLFVGHVTRLLSNPLKDQRQRNVTKNNSVGIGVPRFWVVDFTLDTLNCKYSLQHIKYSSEDGVQVKFLV